jgi:uncharacterized membrane protein
MASVIRFAGFYQLFVVVINFSIWGAGFGFSRGCLECKRLMELAEHFDNDKSLKNWLTCREE